MNILFLTLVDFASVEERNIYTDLLRQFLRNGHKVYAISPVERKKKQGTHLVSEQNCGILKLKTGNIQKTNIFEKGISTLCIESQFMMAIRKYFGNVKFDLILYSTPPITFCKVIQYVKKRDRAKTYLLLKDIFPQNAVDIGLLCKKGIKGGVYKYFRNKEKRLYEISDTIGCMSDANVKYILKHNQEIHSSKIEVCPNSINVADVSINTEERLKIRKKYNIPENKTVFVYGGNLGKPQGIEFMLKCLHTQRKNANVYFLIIGDGTEYERIQYYVEKYKIKNISLHRWLPKEDYDKVLAACDVGMIFLDHRFTIPNFPSRLLGYMGAKLPVLAVTDKATDIGKIIVDNGFGWWCESNIAAGFARKILEACRDDKEIMGSKAYNYLKDNYSTETAYKIIMRRM